MSGEAPTANPVETADAVAPRPTGSELEVLVAIADPVRHAVLRELADGSHPAVKDLAVKLHCNPDQLGRHMQRLCKVGLVIEVRAEGADKRCRYYQIPKPFRSTLPDGRRVLDFSFCVLRFDPV